MVEFIASNGIRLDLTPNQDVTLTLENAMFSNDHIPVAWTTGVELPISTTNSRLFGYPNTMLLTGQSREINVTMYINGIPSMNGKLKLIGKSNGMLQASFAGVSVEDSLVGNLQDAPFHRWDFGPAPLGQRPLFEEIIKGASNNTRDDFALPLMVRESEKDTADNYLYNPEFGAIGYEFFGLKYLNSPKYKYICPVVKLKYILQTVFPDCNIDEVYADYFSKIGIVAPYRKNAGRTTEGLFNLSVESDGTSFNHYIDLAEAMPNITLEDFVKNMLTIFCATIFIVNGEKRMISNKSILQDAEFIDWSHKITDDYQQEFEAGQSYEYGFSGIEDTDINEKIIDCATVADCLNAEDGLLVRCAATGDIYRKIQKPYIAGHGSKTYYMNGLDLIRREAMIPQNTPDKSLDTFTATTDWIPVKCVPHIFIYSPESSMINWYEGVMLPIIEVPIVGGERPTTIQFGALESTYTGEYVPPVQLTTNGTTGESLGFFISGGPSLNLNGTKGLYERYHKDFEDWLSEEKTVSKVRLNLSASDIANLKMWKKIMLYNRLFFIKTLTITFNTSKDYIDTEADFVAV